MNWTARITAAIHYIEANLGEDIPLQTIAAAACASPFHFQRVFYALVGASPTEYARRRRMTLAGTMLRTSNKTVIEIAAELGYHSPNAFTRAFRQFHGCTPSDGRRPDVTLRSVPQARISSKEQDVMEYRIINKPAFVLAGKSQQFTLESFFQQGPAFWKDYVATDAYQALWQLNAGKAGPVSGATMMSAYFPTNSDNREDFIDVLGVECLGDAAAFEQFSVPAATYAEFNCSYKESKKLNRQIYGEWFDATGYERDEDCPDIVAYFPLPFRPMGEMQVRWWIPLKQRC